jgi:hypothetical protein
MLARTGTLQHPSGKAIKTPLLVPSFSSKGFGQTSGGMAEVGQLFRLAREQLTDSMLVSAYDLHHGHLHKPTNILTELVFLDSGGYETSDFQDLSTIFSHPTSAKDWKETDLRGVYDSWPSHIPAVFVSYDRRKPVRQQIRSARSLFKNYPEQLHALLIKPRTKRSNRLPMAELLSDVRELSSFHVIGVTEKELGGSMLERMENIAKLRLALDDAQLRHIPLHIFGSLDPLTVPLYFLSGAEIFDGLTWLRFGYHGGAALYQQNCAVRRFGVHYTDDQVKLLNIQYNLNSLVETTNQMRRFLIDGDFDRLAPNGRDLATAFDLLKTRNPRVD